MADSIDIKALQDDLSRQQAQWTAMDNPIAQLSDSEKRTLLGVPLPPYIESLVAQGKAQSDEMKMARAGAPANFDLRNVNGRNYITPIRNQGGCGSCVAFGSIAAIEGTARYTKQDPNYAIDLSEAHLFYCYGRQTGHSCSTGWIPNEALDAVKGGGLVDEACFPYTDHDQDCGGRCADWSGRLTKISNWQNLTGRAADIKTWVSTKGPCVACFAVYNDFFAYKSGVYHHVSGELAGGHCIAIVGYDDAAGCWICKNSWAASWGDNGFFKIAYGDSAIDSWQVCGVEGVEVEVPWLNNKRIIGLWANDAERNAYAYVEAEGWRKIAPDNDAVFYTILAQLAVAKESARPVNIYQEQNVIKQLYVL